MVRHSDNRLSRMLCLPNKQPSPLHKPSLKPHPAAPQPPRQIPSWEPSASSASSTTDSDPAESSPTPPISSPSQTPRLPSPTTITIPTFRPPSPPQAPSKPPANLPKNHLESQIDPRDTQSPDAWIPRSKTLNRLTGKHPFNAEPPISLLFSEGFLTPLSLHYVRNHGKTPKLSWDSHTLSISGFVKSPTKFSMDQLASLPSITLPVTLVCSANRRKELNMKKQTIGFNWGPAATSTSTWKGVKLADLLTSCGVDMTRARHVHFLAADTEGLPNGLYGTSIDIATAMDPFGDVIVAWEQNGSPIPPDHGFPLRVIVPGWISGRMVKWLDTIQVTDEPSDLYYHYYDNILFPSHVDAEKAHAEGWWFRREYHMNQIQINSVVVTPAHGERINTNSYGAVPVKGYAFSGGGRKITRVEISLDDGKSWKICDVDYPEERFSHAPSFGRYYCWMFWECKVNVSEIRASLAGPAEIRCRAWDQANNSQQRDSSWNLVGMGNNSQFALKIVKKTIDGRNMYEFQHPTVSGASKEGWMTAPQLLSAPEPQVVPPSVKPKKTFTMDEVRKNNSKSSAWIVIDGRVFDCTDYLSDHPGGAPSILMNAGEDTTEDFHAIHSDVATKMLEDYYIGDVEGFESQEPPARNPAVQPAMVAQNPVSLDTKKWNNFELIERVEVTSTVRLLKFKLPSPQHRLGLPVGYYMFVKAMIEGKTVIRAFTPVSSDLGTLTLCVKVYFAGVNPSFPYGGLMSQHLERLEVGDMLSAKGPVGHFEYKGRGRYSLHGVERHTKKFGFICGGTGLTPIYQIMNAVAKDEGDDTEVYVIYANHRESEILMHEEMKVMEASRDNIHVFYTLVERPVGWKGGSGYVNEKMVRAFIPGADEDCVVGVCGRAGMIEEACLPNLRKIGYEKESVVLF